MLPKFVSEVSASGAARYANARNRISFACERWGERFLDRCLGIQTGFIQSPHVAPEHLEAASHAKRYHASNYLYVARALRFVRRRYGHATLIDLGCGAGRVLVVAAALGFREVIGVDIDNGLVEMARENFARYSRRFRSRSHLTLATNSAADVALPADCCCVFLFHPFETCIFERFLQQNRERLSQGDVAFVCINPRLGSLLQQFGFPLVHEWGHQDFSRITRVYYQPGSRGPA